MKINIVGVKSVHFTTKEGNEINGQNVFYTYEDAHVDGVAADRAFLPKAKAVDVNHLPVLAHLEYNKYGKVEEIYIIE